jgi:hypothetical protein
MFRNVVKVKKKRKYKIDKTLKTKEKTIKNNNFLWFLGLIVFISIIGVGISFFNVKAEIAIFYPTNCLGSFSNPQNAQGEPQLELSSDISLFNNENSAVYDGGIKQIFCGGFQGETVEDVDIDSIKLKIVWKLKNIEQTLLEKNIEQVSSEESITEVIDDGITNKEPIIANHSIDTSMTEKIAEEPIAKEEKINIIEEDTEYPILNEEKAAVEVVPEEEVKQEENIEKSEEQVLTFIEDSSNKISNDTKEIFVVKYSLDGTFWQILSVVNKDDMQSEFILPFNSFNNLSSLQISIESLSSENQDIVYVDGMIVEVNYIERINPNKIDYKKDNILEIKSGSYFNVLRVLRGVNNKEEILINEKSEEGEQWRKVADESLLLRGGPIAIKNDVVFFVSSDGMALMGYDHYADSYFSQTIESGTDYYLDFNDKDWFAQYKNGNIQFINLLTGEISLSDDNLEETAIFMGKFEKLSKDEKKEEESKNVIEVIVEKILEPFDSRGEEKEKLEEINPDQVKLKEIKEGDEENKDDYLEEEKIIEEEIMPIENSSMDENDSTEIDGKEAVVQPEESSNDEITPQANETQPSVENNDIPIDSSQNNDVQP